MNRLDEIKLDSLQDSWVIMYTFIAKELLEAGGFEGEVALREAIRRFGRDRGLTNQKRLLDNNIKINMRTLFCEGRDRPAESRFTGYNTYEDREEYQICIHICSYADVWKRYNAKAIGRIYCEEFHIACYETFGFGATKVNLARSMTQEGDDRCIFNHTFRPENMTEEKRQLCFEEYDEDYVLPSAEMPKPQGKSGFNMLWIKMYYYLLECACEQFGDFGRIMVGNGLRAAAVEQAKVFISQAEATEQVVDYKYVEDHLPLYMDYESEPLWNTYSKFGARRLLAECFYRPFLKEVGLE
jgi:hypothetical protein